MEVQQAMKLLEPTSPNQAFNKIRNHIPTVKSSRKSELQSHSKEETAGKANLLTLETRYFE
ncbi:hypothetical protein DCAR_0729377 [Daucus carota subsp. sativus]|uniref:Uncharacterized protein n=1 Tax=Daucus carota subsp. sativus TaxID=79200 RepID=A0A164U731_DAUCS|nr:hypothetical protein DCAR_0729377 [Daucus carota subsp. sativus]